MALRTRVLTLAAVLLLLLMTAIPAQADKPVPYEYDFPSEPYPVADCAQHGLTYWVLQQDFIHVDGTRFFDDALVKAIEHVQGTSYLFNPADPTDRLSYEVQYTAHLTFTSWDPFGATVKFTGVGVNLQLPGEGIVLHDAGMAVFDISSEPWEMLHHVGQNKWDWQTVCEVLAE